MACRASSSPAFRISRRRVSPSSSPDGVFKTAEKNPSQGRRNKTWQRVSLQKNRFNSVESGGKNGCVDDVSCSDLQFKHLAISEGPKGSDDISARSLWETTTIQAVTHGVKKKTVSGLNHFWLNTSLKKTARVPHLESGKDPRCRVRIHRPPAEITGRLHDTRWPFGGREGRRGAASPFRC